MTYSEATDSYNNDYLEPILSEETGFLHNIPYRIDKEKYLEVLKKYSQNNRFKDADVVVFHSDYCVHDEGDIWMRSFFAFPENSPENSDDFYDCFLFEDDEVDVYFDFVKEILGCIIGPDKECLAKEFEERNEELRVLTKNISTIKTILDCDKTCK